MKKIFIILFLSFFLATSVFAVVGYVDPNGDQTVTNAFLFSSGTTHYVLIDDGTRQPTTPNTADYIQETSAGTGNVAFSMTTLTGVSSVSSIKVWIYGLKNNVGDTFTGNISKDGSNWATAQDFGLTTSGSWKGVTFSGLSWTQADLDALQVRLIANVNVGGPTYCYAMYAEITYTASTTNLTFNKIYFIE